MKKADREKVFNKYGGRCAYCGCQLIGRFHVDHINPVFRDDTDEAFERRITHGNKKKAIVRGTNDIENLNPACPRCNGWKATMDIETFRKEIAQQVERARAYSCNFRMAEDFGLIAATKNEVIFWFEKHNSITP